MIVKHVERTDPEVKVFAEWLAKDVLHQELGITLDDFFAIGTQLIAVYDGSMLVMAVRYDKLQNILHFAIQFNPDCPFKTAKLSKRVINWLKERAKVLQCDILMCRPGGKAIKFAEKLGFMGLVGKKERFMKV